MKNATKGLLLMTMIVIATVVKAKVPNENVNVEITGNRSFQLSVNNLMGKGQISIIDQNGFVLYNNIIAGQSAIKQRFDVSNLPVGNYYLKLNDEWKNQTLSLLINQELVFDLAHVKTTLNPIITQKDDEVTVSMYASELEKLNVSIYDQNSNLLESSNINGLGYLGRRFNFGKLKHTPTALAARVAKM